MKEPLIQNNDGKVVGESGFKLPECFRRNSILLIFKQSI